jgi:hypothetical protein
MCPIGQHLRDAAVPALDGGCLLELYRTAEGITARETEENTCR